jgi:hypothetical protein
MSGVFVSYRRVDEPFGAGMIHKALVDRLGEDLVFLDNQSLPLGRDFERRLWSALRRSDALIVVIGPRWLSTDDGGQLLIGRDDDFVRREIAEALDLDLSVVPVLLGGASLPESSLLPNDIKALCQQQYSVVGTDDPTGDIKKFTDRLVHEARLPVLRPAAPEAPGSLAKLTRVRNTGAIAIGTGGPQATNINIGSVPRRAGRDD